MTLLTNEPYPLKFGFASDNQAGVLPQVMEALLKANYGHAPAYGYDPWTKDLQALIQHLFGSNSHCFPVYNGTGANVLALQALLRPYQSVLCAESAHIQEDECGAPERFLGVKLQSVPTINGKIQPIDIENHLHYRGDEHRVQLRAVSITQPTEWGTLYQPQEIIDIADCCHKNGLLLHMDGARISNAAAALNLPFRAFTSDAGVDVLSLGGTKNGIMFGELLITFKKGLDQDLLFFRKQLTQLHSKMRFISAQFLPWLQQNWWLETAQHANQMAATLSADASKVPGVRLAHPTEVNGVFACIPVAWNKDLMEFSPFYIFHPPSNMARWMCAFDTQKSHVDLFLQQLYRLAQNNPLNLTP